MKAYCLASSSQGNCYVLEFEVNGEPTRIMVECGISFTEILKKMSQFGLDISKIESCLITHAHADHCKAAKNLDYYNIPLYMSEGTFELLKLGKAIPLFKPTKIAEGIFALPFEVEHDIPGAVGFIIKTSKECVLFVNDHKRWTSDLRKFKPNYIFIECNYDHKVVYAQLTGLKKLKREGNLTLEQLRETNSKIAQHERNLNAHCSLHGTLYGLKKLNLKECKTIFLMHLSDRYANEYRMKSQVQLETGILTYVCGKGGGIK